MSFMSSKARQFALSFLSALTLLLLVGLAPIKAEASAVVFVGNVGYVYSGSTAVLTAERVQNNSVVGSTSGTLRMELWAFSTPFSGASQTGYKLSQYTLGTLPGGNSYVNISSGTISFGLPPNGSWYVAMLLTEYTAAALNDGYTTRDWVNFNNLITVGTPPPLTSALENPQPGSYQSGIGLISGWSCNGPNITYSIDGGSQQYVPYGSSRTDTGSVCSGNLSTGFGALVNFSALGSGTHSVQLYVNGVASGTLKFFTVTAPSGSFLVGAAREISVPNFPTAGRTTTLVWQEATQNFNIKSVVP